MKSSIGSIRSGMLASLLVASAVVGAPAVGAERSRDQAVERETHCIAYLDEVAGRSVAEECFATLVEVDRRLGSPGGSASRSSNVTIARHYKSQSYGGSSISIVGTVCNGGTWTPSGSWRNNIESSKIYCGGPTVRHYDSSSCTGSAFSTSTSKTTLGWMNNKTSCVRYG